jgi:hypothetical protein
VIILLTAAMLVVMLALLAFSVDLGYMITVESELKRATDAAALAGAGALTEGSDNATSEAFAYLARNPIAGQTIYKSDGWSAYSAEWLAQHPEEFTTKLGDWDPSKAPGSDLYHDARFSEYQASDGTQPPSAIEITATRPNSPLFFAKIFGQNSFSVKAQTIARYQPRDIVLVLDFSRSMDFDSNLIRISDFGETARAGVETSLANIYADLGSPTYGTLPFAPQYATVPGTSASVQFCNTSVNVTATKTMKSVIVYKSTTTTYGTSKTASGTTGTFSNSGSTIAKVKITFADNTTETITADTAGLKKAFGLTNVAYPYGSDGTTWDRYFSYAQTDGYINNAGYRWKFGCMTLINYWLEYQSSYSENPDLWKCRVEPIDTVKQASGVFFDFIQQVKTNDRVAFVLYTSSNGAAITESHLTEDFASVKNVITHRQAGHYTGGTNIGDGVKYALNELTTNGRQGAFKMIVLMTDGNANLPSSESYARSYTLTQAAACTAKRYPIFTIGLGMDADAALLQTVATDTKGAYFGIAGGQTVVDYKPALLAAFRKIANARPLQIVK